jgi:hypothetical protein
MVMFCWAVIGQCVYSCAITATRSHTRSGGTDRSETSSQRMSPPSGAYSPARILARVLLPEPFSPTSATTSPRRTSSEIPFSDGVSAPG